MAVNNMAAERHVGKSSGRTPPWMLAGLIVGADLGLLAGMAYANTFTRDLGLLILFSLGGAVLVGGLLTILGWIMDVMRPSVLAGAIVGGVVGLIAGIAGGYVSDTFQFIDVTPGSLVVPALIGGVVVAALLALVGWFMDGARESRG